MGWQVNWEEDVIWNGEDIKHKVIIIKKIIIIILIINKQGWWLRGNSFYPTAPVFCFQTAFFPPALCAHYPQDVFSAPRLLFRLLSLTAQLLVRMFVPRPLLRNFYCACSRPSPATSRVPWSITCLHHSMSTYCFLSSTQALLLRMLLSRCCPSWMPSPMRRAGCRAACPAPPVASPSGPGSSRSSRLGLPPSVG